MMIRVCYKTSSVSRARQMHKNVRSFLFFFSVFFFCSLVLLTTH